MTTRVRAALGAASHVLSSVPPADGGDPVLERYGDALAHGWLGYLSSTGVYGDTGGAWVDESAPVGSGPPQRARAKPTRPGWQRGARVFRLPGIYGPGRSALDRVREGRAHRIDLPDQVFSRIHVDDLAAGVIAGPRRAAGRLQPGRRPAREPERGDRGGLPPARARAAAAAVAGGRRPLARRRARFMPRTAASRTARPSRVLGWRPRYPDFRERPQGLLRERRVAPPERDDHARACASTAARDGQAGPAHSLRARSRCAIATTGTSTPL